MAKRLTDLEKAILRLDAEIATRQGEVDALKTARDYLVAQLEARPTRTKPVSTTVFKGKAATTGAA